MQPVALQLLLPDFDAYLFEAIGALAAILYFESFMRAMKDPRPDYEEEEDP